MKIHSLKLRNYRRFEDFTFQFHPQFTVIIGNNALGKSTILDALAIMLGTYLLKFEVGAGCTGITQEEARLKIFKQDDQITSEQQKPTFLEVEGVLHNNKFKWKRNLGDRGRDAKDIISVGASDYEAVQKGEDITLPVLLYYGTGRLWGKHQNVPVGKPDSRTVGYKNCLDPKSDHFLFEKWFKKLALVSLQKKKNIKVLETVRNAVKTCIPQAKHFDYDIANDVLMIDLEGEGYCFFDNLSDGYRNMVAMVADIAHRAARLNPHLGAQAATESSGVVLVDDLDLHLHPQWQRLVVGNLQEAFPNIQFISTTHSPFILQSFNFEVINLHERGYYFDKAYLR